MNIWITIYAVAADVDDQFKDLEELHKGHIIDYVS